MYILLLQGSYGRLGLGNSDTQTTLKDITTFPTGTILHKISNSKGSDGHSLGVDQNGRVYSWGDGMCECILVYVSDSLSTSPLPLPLLFLFLSLSSSSFSPSPSSLPLPLLFLSLSLSFPSQVNMVS